MPFDRAKFPQQYLHRHQHYQLIIWITPETQITMLFMSLVKFTQKTIFSRTDFYDSLTNSMHAVSK